jgi:cell division protein FtsQ
LSATSTPLSPEGSGLRRFRRPVGIEARRRKVRALVMSAAGVLVVAAAAVAVSRSAIFSAQHVAILGNHQLSDRRIERLAGLSGHPNVLWMSMAGIERRLLADPWVASASVSRSLPGSITVTMTEREPAAMAWSGLRAFLVAGDGRVLGPADLGTRRPVIQRPDGFTLQSGSRVPASLPALRVAAALPAALSQRIATVKLGGRGVELTTRDGVRVIYGDASDTVAKGIALEAVLVWVQQHDVKPLYIDVSAPSAPAVMPIGAQVGGSSSNAGTVQIVPVPGTGASAGAGGYAGSGSSTSPTP